MRDQLISHLIETLQDEYQYYQKLRDLADSKNDAIVANDVDKLSDLIENDKKVIETLDNLEAERNDILKEMRDILGLDEGELEYEVLADNLSETWTEKLNEVREKLLKVMEELHEINEQNKVLLQEAIKLNNFSFQMISDVVEPNTQTYNNQKNKKDKSNNKINRIIDRRA